MLRPGAVVELEPCPPVVRIVPAPQSGFIACNVPRTAVHYSRCARLDRYFASREGRLDLAINILNGICARSVPCHADALLPCRIGIAHTLAMEFARTFADEFLNRIPDGGRQIPAFFIEAWLRAKVQMANDPRRAGQQAA